jgi:hypothetical protein
MLVFSLTMHGVSGKEKIENYTSSHEGYVIDYYVTPQVFFLSYGMWRHIIT